MRCATLITIAVIGVTCLISGCAAVRDSNGKWAGQDCPALEGYPDCQNGHRIDPLHLNID
jgi:hypothetical protein